MSNKQTERIVAFRVPSSLPDEIRTITGVPFATIARKLCMGFLEAEKRRAAAKLAQEEKPNG